MAAQRPGLRGGYVTKTKRKSPIGFALQGNSQGHD